MSLGCSSSSPSSSSSLSLPHFYKKQNQHKQPEAEEKNQKRRPQHQKRPSSRHKLFGTLLRASLAAATAAFVAASHGSPFAAEAAAAAAATLTHHALPTPMPSRPLSQSVATLSSSQLGLIAPSASATDYNNNFSMQRLLPTKQQQQFHDHQKPSTSGKQEPVSFQQHQTTSISHSNIQRPDSTLSLSRALALTGSLSSDDDDDAADLSTSATATQNAVDSTTSGSTTSTSTSTFTTTTTTTATFSNSWQDFMSNKPFPSGYTKQSIILISCVIGTIILLIGVGNLLVCIAIFTEKSLKPTQNWFIASLAVSDMMLGLVVMPFSLARELMGFWVFGTIWCDIHEAVDVLLTTASINTLCLISLDRYWSITNAVDYLKKRTPLRAAGYIAFVWCLSAGVSLPPLFLGERQMTPIKVQVPGPTLQAINSTTSTTPTTANDFRLIKRQIISQERDQLSTPVLTLAQFNRMQLNHHNYQHLRQRQHQRQTTNYLVDVSNSGSSDYVDMPTTGSDSRSSINDLYEQQQTSSITSDIATRTSTTTSAPIINQEINNQLQQQGGYVIEYPTCQLSDNILYVLYSAFISFYIPCGVMVFTYMRIHRAAKSRARRTIVAKPTSRQKQQADRDRSHGRHLATGASTITNGRTISSNGTASGGGGSSQTGRLLVEASMFSLGAAATPTGRLLDNRKSPISPPLPADHPLMRGKIVIVERRKSIAASSLAPLDPLTPEVDHDHDGHPEPVSEMSTTTSGLALTKDNHRGSISNNEQTTSCTLTTSGAVPAAIKPPAGSGNGSKPEVRQKQDPKKRRKSQDEPSEKTIPSSGSIANEMNEKSKRHSDSTSSIVTVMKPSMAEVPVTRFNFQTNETELLASQSRAEEEKKNAYALLEAITSLAASAKSPSISGDSIAAMATSGSANQPTILNVKDKRQDDNAMDKRINETYQQSRIDCLENDKTDQLIGPSTKETCFMTMDEEDSEMIDAQAGRTILMMTSSATVAAGGGQKHGLRGDCMNPTCHKSGHRRQAARRSIARTTSNTVGGDCIVASTGTGNRSESSYCGSEGSGIHLNDEDNLLSGGVCNHRPAHSHKHHGLELDDEVEEDEDDGLLLSEDGEYNGYSISCPLDDEDDDDSCSRCHECGELVDDDGTSNNSTYAGNCHRVGGGGNASSSISVDSPCHRKPPIKTRSNSAAVSMTPSRSRHADNARMIDLETGKDHHHHGHHHHSGDYYDDEADEMDTEIDDEDEDMDEDEEETSSVLEQGGGDMLDATAGPLRSTSKRKSRGGEMEHPEKQVKSNQQSQASRKLSIIGIRLPSLGGASSGQPKNDDASREELIRSANSNKDSSATERHTGKHYTCDRSNSQQDDRQGESQTRTTPATTSTTATLALSTITTATTATTPVVAPIGGSGTRNLKALRQTFFLKLNQLTAKSSSKSGSNTHKNQKLLSASSSDKPSLSYEPSTSCAMDYPMETTVVDDYEPQTSGENQNSGHTIELEGVSSANQQVANSSDQTIDDDMITGTTGQYATENGKGVTLVQADRGNYSSDKNNFGANNKRPAGGGGTKSMIISSSMAEKSSIGFDDNDSRINMSTAATAHRLGAGGFKKIVKIANSTNDQPAKRAHLPSDTERHKRKLAKARERRATLILGMIMSTFILAWMPFFTFYVLRAVCVSCRDYVSPPFEAIIFWMGYCNSAINPIIYTIFNRDFRKAFRKIIFKCI